MIRLAVAGAAGRMGTRIVALASADKRFALTAPLESPTHARIGTDAGTLAGVGILGVPIADRLPDPPAKVNVLIDFSTPAGSMRSLALCVEAGCALVMGTTGHSDEQLAAIREAAERIPLLKASNMSVGMNLMFQLAGRMAAALGNEYDIEIVEAHHRFKADAPSGTALTLRDRILEATGRRADTDVVYGRQGQTGARPARQIGMHALRIGDTVGEHAVHFGTLGETVTLAHSAHTRDTFVQGALRAAAWIVDQSPGLYDMQDVLQIK